MLKKLIVTFILASTLVDLYRFTWLGETLPEVSITLTLCVAVFYLFNHLIALIYLDSINSQED